MYVCIVCCALCLSSFDCSAVQLYCDFHGHSQLKNVVLFACPDPSGGVATEVSKPA